MTQEPYTTESVRRDFVEYDHPEGAYTLSAHRVTESTQGQVLAANGSVVYAPVGSYLVETSRPDVYEVHPKDAFEGYGLEPVRDQEDLTPSEDVTQREPDFDPNTVDAATVRRYLRRVDVDEAERNRVIRAERNGANRKSAIPNGMDVTDSDDDTDGLDDVDAEDDDTPVV